MIFLYVFSWLFSKKGRKRHGVGQVGIWEFLGENLDQIILFENISINKKSVHNYSMVHYRMKIKLKIHFICIMF